MLDDKETLNTKEYISDEVFNKWKDFFYNSCFFRFEGITNEMLNYFDNTKRLLTVKQLEEWVVELESGNYKKGVRRLSRVSPEGKSFCCLGVLAELNNMLKSKTNATKEYFIDVVYGNEAYLITIEAHERVVYFLPERIQSHLSMINDRGPNKDKNFEDVISFIKEVVIPMFKYYYKTKVNDN